MSGRTLIRQVLVTMATMYVLNTVAESGGANVRRFIRGERTLLERIFGG